MYKNLYTDRLQALYHISRMFNRELMKLIFYLILLTHFAYNLLLLETYELITSSNKTYVFCYLWYFHYCGTLYIKYREVLIVNWAPDPCRSYSEHVCPIQTWNRYQFVGDGVRQVKWQFSPSDLDLCLVLTFIIPSVLVFFSTMPQNNNT